MQKFYTLRCLAIVFLLPLAGAACSSSNAEGMAADTSLPLKHPLIFNPSGKSRPLYA
jgi:hypothetical protein